MTSLERVLTAMSYQEPDKVPLMQMFSFYGAKEMGTTIRDYYSNPEYQVEAQVKLQKKFKNDCYNGSMYGAIDFEAFGGTTIFVEDGPPNAGCPIIRSGADIEALKVPIIESTLCLQQVLKLIKMLKQEARESIPIVGLVISPFSLPVMQMGFDHYLDLMHENPEMFQKLMKINKEFCIQWANAQLDAGATAICYFDPVSSPTIIPREIYKNTGWQIAKEVLPAIHGGTATHFASGRTISVIPELIETGTNMMIASAQEDIGEVKKMAQGKIAVMGNLNGIEMCRWDTVSAEEQVKNIIKKAANGGGLLISDNHGEIPYQVSEKVLLAISDAVEKYGYYSKN